MDTVDSVDEHGRRELIDVFGERLAEAPDIGMGCSVFFYRQDGTLIGKSTHHQPLFAEATIP